MRRGPVALIIADQLEAVPFIKGLKLKKVPSGPFPVYKSKGLALVISGIGRSNAAMATAWACTALSPRILLNLGAAGSTDGKFLPGDCLQVARAVEPERKHLRNGAAYEHRPATLKGFRCAVTATMDRAVLSGRDRKALARMASLVEMECAAFIQACHKFDRRCYAFKLVTDAPGHTSSADIIYNLKKYRDSFFSFFSSQVLPKLR